MRSMFLDLLFPGALLLGGGLLGWFFRSLLGRTQAEMVRGESRENLNRSLKEAEHQKRQALLQAREEWLKAKATLEQELANRAGESERRDQALEQRESGLRDKDALLRTRERAIEQHERETQETRSDARRELDRARRLAGDLSDQLSRVSGLTTQDAKQLLLENIRQEVRVEAARMIREAREEAHKKAETEACKIVSLAIERTASEWTAERSVTAFPIPSEKLKGRIIGHEGK
ncbi:MAG: DUF3552 domain-containing protein, partial [Acidobacteria bacterium]|nr:DUF3552 domain-containing protein [Acidobacteriota bacterium]